jgi:phage tail-like protein
MVANRFDPYRAFEFTLVFDGKSRAGFHECFGLTPPSRSPRPKLPGPLFLRRGITADPAFWSWYKTAARRGGSIVVRDLGGVERFRCKFSRGRLAKWTGPEFNATGTDVSIETLVLVHEGMDLED